MRYFRIASTAVFGLFWVAWILVVVFLLFAAGLAYFQFMGPRE